MSTWHDVDVLTDTHGNDFYATTCTRCGTVTGLDQPHGLA